MELKEFLGKFGGLRMGQIEAMSKENIDGYSFSQALQIFTDEVCKAQKQKIAAYFEHYPLISMGILEVDQPEIEEL